MNKTLLLVVALIIVAIGGWYLLGGKVQQPAGNTPTSADDAPAGSIHNLPVPDAVAAVRAYVAQKAAVREGLVIIMTVYEKEWSDSCLGLGGPAESCLQAITPGWEVSAQASGETHTYRTSADGSVIRQEK